MINSSKLSASSKKNYTCTGKDMVLVNFIISFSLLFPVLLKLVQLDYH